MANNLAAFNIDQFSKALVANLDKINVMLPLVNRDWEGDISRGVGSTVYVRTLGSVTMGAYTKNSTTISYEDLAPAREAFTVDDAQYFAFKVDDVDANSNDLDALELYAKRAAVSLSDVVENKILSVYGSAHADNRITGASNAAITLSTTNIYDNFVEARTRLSKKNVPTAGRFAIIDPDSYALVLKCAEFKRDTPVGDDAIRNGFVGSMAGFDIYESNSVPTASGAKYLMFGDNQAIAYAAQVTEVETIRLESSFATAVRGLLVHDAAVFAEASKRLATVKATA